MAFGLFKKKAEYADKVFFNAHIYTQDMGLPWAEAVAVKGDKILTVGHYEEMESIINDDTELIDLEEKYMLPGFIDIHRSPVVKLYMENAEEIERDDEETEDRNPFDFKNIYAMELEEDQMEEEEAEQNSISSAILGSGMGEDVAEAEDIIVEVEESLTDEDVNEEFEVVVEGAEEGQLDDEEVYYIDNSEYEAKVKEALDALSDHGITTVLNLQTADRLEEEFEDAIINMYTNGLNTQRFFGSLYMNIPANPLLVQATLNKRRTRVTEIGDRMRNEVLYISIDSAKDRAQFDEEGLTEVLLAVSDRGYIIYMEAAEHNDLLMAYKAADTVRDKGYKNQIIIASDEELTEAEKSQLSFNGTVFKSWANNVLSAGFFNGNVENIEDAIDELTIYPAEMLGMEEVLGSIEKGKYADFAIFDDNPLETGVRELSRMNAVMTVVGGEIIMDAEKENDDFMMEMMFHQQF